MTDFEKEFAKRLDDAFFGMMTNNVPQEPQGTFSMAHLQYTMATMPRSPVGPPRIVESEFMYDEIFDWSKARSPSRTKRRMRFNYRRIVTRVPKKEALSMPDGSLVMHPQMAALVRNHCQGK